MPPPPLYKLKIGAAHNVTDIKTMDDAVRTENTNCEGEEEEWACSLLHIFIDPMPCLPPASTAPAVSAVGDAYCTTATRDAHCTAVTASLASVVKVPGPPPLLRSLRAASPTSSCGPISPVLGPIHRQDNGGSVLPDMSCSQDSGFSDASSDSAPSADWGGLASMVEEEEEEKEVEEEKEEYVMQSRVIQQASRQTSGTLF